MTYIHLIRLKSKDEEFYKLRRSQYDTVLPKYFRPYTLSPILVISCLPGNFAEKVIQAFVAFRKDLSYKSIHNVHGRCFTKNPFNDASQLLEKYISAERPKAKEKIRETRNHLEQDKKIYEELIQSFHGHILECKNRMDAQYILRSIKAHLDQLGAEPVNLRKLKDWAAKEAEKKRDQEQKNIRLLKSTIQKARGNISAFTRVDNSIVETENQRLVTMDYLESIMDRLRSPELIELVNNPHPIFHSPLHLSLEE